MVIPPMVGRLVHAVVVGLIRLDGTLTVLHTSEQDDHHARKGQDQEGQEQHSESHDYASLIAMLASRVSVLMRDRKAPSER